MIYHRSAFSAPHVDTFLSTPDSTWSSSLLGWLLTGIPLNTILSSLGGTPSVVLAVVSYHCAMLDSARYEAVPQNGLHYVG